MLCVFSPCISRRILFLHVYLECELFLDDINIDSDYNLILGFQFFSSTRRGELFRMPASST